MTYPTFRLCPYCGERMVLGFHVSSIAVGLLIGFATFLLLAEVFGLAR